MTEPRNPLDQALDLVVYAPLGLAITVLEDFGDLAEKGRVRVQQRTGAARLIGQFAVAEARRRLGMDGTRSRGRSDHAASRSAGAPENTDRGWSADPGGGSGSGPAPTVPADGEPGATGQDTSSGDAGAGGRSAIDGGVAGAAPGAASNGSGDTAASSSHLGIPGYDSLSASQVVQRLPSLSSSELAAVAEYESATRGRRTILSRIAQLQQG